MRQKDAFEVLGMPKTADWDDVERAYAMQSDRFAQSRYASQPAEIRALAEEIRAAIQHAYNELDDPARLAILRSQTAVRPSGAYSQRAERRVAVGRLDSEPPLG